jgi:hypothetical protein
MVAARVAPDHRAVRRAVRHQRGEVQEVGTLQERADTRMEHAGSLRALTSPSQMRLSAVATIASSLDRGSHPSTRRLQKPQRGLAGHRPRQPLVDQRDRPVPLSRTGARPNAVVISVLRLMPSRSSWASAGETWWQMFVGPRLMLWGPGVDRSYGVQPGFIRNVTWEYPWATMTAVSQSPWIRVQLGVRDDFVCGSWWPRCWL